MNNPLFTIVTPTFNRASLLSRVFDSLQEQTMKDFEWIIIDDGSTDHTKIVVDEFKMRASFRIIYLKTKNRGKVHALNHSMNYCKGFFYIVFDSDDWCDSNALEVYYDEWKKVQNKNDFFALSALKRDQNNNLIGNDYSKIDKYNCSYIDRANLEIKGDKWDCFVFDKIKDFRFPIESQDKYMAPSYLLYKLSECNKVIFINKVISTVEYLPDGISANNISHRVKSAATTYKYYKDMLEISQFSNKMYFRHKVNKYRFLLHSKQKIKFKSIVDPAFSSGLLLYLKDKYTLRNSINKVK